MGTYQTIANNLANRRTKAYVTPKRALSKAIGILSFHELKAFLVLCALVTLILGGYVAMHWKYVPLNFEIAYVARYPILTFALLGGIPLYWRMLSGKFTQAAELMTQVRYWFLQLCVWTTVGFFITSVLVYFMAEPQQLGSFWLQWFSRPPSAKQMLFISGFNQLWAIAAGLLWVTFLLTFLWTKHSEAAAEKKLASPFRLYIGRSTGLLAKRQHSAGIASNQPLTLSADDAAQNIVIFGGIGAGKTTRAINPLLLQLLDQDCGGVIFDIKGDFHQTVAMMSNELGRYDRLIYLGIGGQPINLIAGLSPPMVASFLKSSMLLSGQGQGDSAFWADTATTLCTNVLGLLSLLPDHYSLDHVYNYIFNPDAKIAVHEQLQTHLNDNAEKLRLFNYYSEYLDNVFNAFNEKTRNDVLATVAQVLSPFRNPVLIDAFCQTSPLTMEKVLDGSIFLIKLPLSEWGLGAKVAYNFIKLRFFNVMQSRVQHPDWDQERSIFFLCDEYQEIITGNRDGLSDLNFWDKSRSSKTIGIISAQSISSFYAAIGNRDVANAVLQNFRQRLCFGTEDKTTLEEFQSLTGRTEIERKSYSKQRGSSGTQSHSSRSENVTPIERLIIDSQLMRSLKPEQAIAILMIKGQACDDVINMEWVK